MTAAEKAALAWLDAFCRDAENENARTVRRMLAEPRLPKEPSIPALEAMQMADGGAVLGWYRLVYSFLYAYLTRLHVDFGALDEARMDDSSDAGASPLTPTGEKVALRKAISVLRGWSAEAAGRTGLAESVLIVCNAAESTLPLQMYRIRGRNFEMVRAGPISISEVPND